MKLSQISFYTIELKENIVKATVPLILESIEADTLANDVFRIYKQKINAKAIRLDPRRREANADTYPITCKDTSPTLFHVIYDVDSTRISVEAQNVEEAEKVYRIFREQRIIKPDIEYIRKYVKGNIDEIVAALLWQVGAIKVSLGDLKPLFKVDERKNRSPIYIDVKCLPNYPSINDFIVSEAALLASNIEFNIICGIEAGSISFATSLSEKFNLPMCFARRKRRYAEASLLDGIKEHEIYKRKVLLVDDTIVKGWTKERVIDEIRLKEGIIENCLVIFDRQQGGSKALDQKGIELCSLTNREAALSKSISNEITFLTDREYEEVLSYFKDPKEWHKRKDLPYYELLPKERN